MPSSESQSMGPKPQPADEADFDLYVDWDVDGIVSASTPAATTSMVPAPIVPAPQQGDAAWLEARLAGIAASLEGTIKAQDPSAALNRFTERLDNFEARVEAAVERANAEQDRESLRFIEAHVREIDEQFDKMRGKVERLGTIDARVSDIWDHIQLDLPAPGAGLAGLVEGAVTRALAAANVLRADAAGRDTPAVTSGNMLRIEEALARLLERVESIEFSALQAVSHDPALDIERLDAAFAHGVRVLGGVVEGVQWKTVTRGHVLHAHDYTAHAPRRRALPLADPQLVEDILVPAGSETTVRAVQVEDAVALASEPEPSADRMLQEFKRSALRARAQAQSEAAAVESTHEPAKAQTAPASKPDGARTVTPSASPQSVRPAASTAAAQASKRPLSQGRWYRGFFVSVGMLILGSASYMAVDHMMASPDAAEPHSLTLADAGRTAAIPEPQDTPAATPVALPPTPGSDTPGNDAPGAAARAATLPATIASASLRHAAANGDPAAEFEIGARYSDGRGVSPDASQAFVWYQRASMHGYAPAQFRLGAHYERGIGVEKEPERAKIWYRRAAEKGHVKAMHNLAVLIAQSPDARDLAQAAQWFREAADRNLPDSQFNLALLYETGKGVPVNMAEAFKWYALAARSGDMEAARRMEMVRTRLSHSEATAAQAAVTSWMPSPVSAMPGNPTAAERAAP